MASSLLNILLDSKFQCSTLTILLLAFIGRFALSLLPRARLAHVEGALEEVKDMVLAAEEKGSNPQFILEVRLALQVYVANSLHHHSVLLISCQVYPSTSANSVFRPSIPPPFGRKYGCSARASQCLSISARVALLIWRFVLK